MPKVRTLIFKVLFDDIHTCMSWCFYIKVLSAIKIRGVTFWDLRLVKAN